jgi:hypothetical protein
MTAQAVTITENPSVYGELEKLRKVTFDWTSTDAGVVADSTTAGQVNKTTQKYTGEIIRLITDPAGSTDAPSDNYDVIIKDDDGYDVLMGAGVDRDTANTEQVLASSLGCVYGSCLSLIIAAAGNAKKGKVILYIK